MTRKDVERLVIGMLMALAWWGCDVDYGRTDRHVRHVTADEAYAMADTCVLLYDSYSLEHRIAHIEGDTMWVWADFEIAKRYPGRTFIVYGIRDGEYVARWLPEVVIMDGAAAEWREAGFQVAEDTAYAQRVRGEEQWQREMNNWWWGPPTSWIRADGGAE